jgi:hypothetical protein
MPLTKKTPNDNLRKKFVFENGNFLQKYVGKIFMVKLMGKRSNFLTLGNKKIGNFGQNFDKKC